MSIIHKGNFTTISMQLPCRMKRFGKDGAGRSTGSEAHQKDPDVHCVPAFRARSGRRANWSNMREVKCIQLQLGDVAVQMPKPFAKCLMRGTMAPLSENPSMVCPSQWSWCGFQMKPSRRLSKQGFSDAWRRVCRKMGRAVLWESEWLWSALQRVMSLENHAMLSCDVLGNLGDTIEHLSPFPWPSLVGTVPQGEERLITTNSPLAFLKSELSGSHNLAKASRKASRRFFTKRLCPPHGWIGMKPLLEKSLLKKYNDSVETWFWSSCSSLSVKT